MRMRWSALVIMLCLLAGCNLSSGQRATPTSPATALVKPVVTIDSPINGAEVVANTPLVVSATARDSVGVTAVRLYANDQIVRTIQPDSATGQTRVDVRLDYTPTQAGTLKLEVRAYRGGIESDPAIVTVTVRSSATQIVATLPPIIVNPIITQISTFDPTCRALTNVGINLRSGPSTNYPILQVIGAGITVPIIGRLGDNSWWQVRFGSVIGWVSASLTTQYGNCFSVPIVPPPPPPVTLTPIPPTNTLTRTPVIPTATHTPGLPDLVVTQLSGEEVLALNPGNTPVTSVYSVVITNTGSGATGQFNNLLTIKPTGTELLLGVIGNLNAGESIVLNINVTFDVAGAYILEARADSDSQVTEVSEVNNTGSINVTVNNAP